MATLVTRTTDQPDGTTAKGSELTHAEVDANFINLNSDKVEVSGAIVFAAKAGEALTKGDVVYVSGVSGNEPVVSKADADDASKMPAFGLAETDANNNAAVNVVTFGTLYDLDTSGFTAGDTVYVSTTAGSLTATKPAGESSLIQNIGKVIRSHASAGSIKVGGAGRSNDTPNLNDGNVFIGNASNQAEARTLTGDDISGGTITSFASTGIDDNATSTAITIDSSQSVGIGTNSPAEILHIADTSTGGAVGLRAENSEGHVNFTTNGGGFQFETGASGNVATIDSSGNVGIGTTSPGDYHSLSQFVVAQSGDAGITIASGSSNDGRIFFADGTSGSAESEGTIRYDHSDNSMYFSTSDTERMSINASGVDMSGNLHCGNVTDISMDSSGNGHIQIDGNAYHGAIALDANAMNIYHNSSSRNLVLGTNETARVTIAGNGDNVSFTPIIIGKANTTTNFNSANDSGSISIRSNGAAPAVMSFHRPSAYAVNFGLDGSNMKLGGWSASTTKFLWAMGSGNFHADGNVVAYSTSVSDERFKDDVQPITGALDTVDALQGVTFTWNAGSREGQRDYGLIAQEVEKVLPEVVHESAMPLMTDDDNDTLYKTIDYDKLISVLINAVSELRAEVEALKNGASV